MFNKKDYRAYFEQLYAIEVDMRKECDALLKRIDHPEAKALIARMRADEVRHARLVKELMNLI